jgi:hypothetical protein
MCVIGFAYVPLVFLLIFFLGSPNFVVVYVAAIFWPIMLGKIIRPSIAEKGRPWYLYALGKFINGCYTFYMCFLIFGMLGIVIVLVAKMTGLAGQHGPLDGVKIHAEDREARPILEHWITPKPSR